VHPGKYTAHFEGVEMIYRIQSKGGDLWWEGLARSRENALEIALAENAGDDNACGLIRQCTPYPMVDHTIMSKHEDHRDNLD
jgi:hypothetical protein